MYDWLKNAYNVVLNPNESLLVRPKEVNEILLEYGNYRIKNVIICRNPLKDTINFLLDILTLGEFKQEMKKYSYDKMFHLFMLIQLENDDILLCERNQRVLLKIIPNYNYMKIYESINLYVTSNVTLYELFDNAEKNDSNLYRYDAVYHNCQNFIKTLSLVYL